MTPKQWNRLQELFESASDLPDHQREAYLEAACADDAELLREARALVLCGSRAGEFLEHPALRPRTGAAGAKRGTATAPGDSRDAHGAIAGEGRPDPLVGRRIGAYDVIRRVAAGGMGVVYEAQQQSPRRRVALKILKPGSVSPALLRRFEQEAELLGRLQHPGIAQIFEAGTASLSDDESEQPFFAMEFVVGATLTEFVASRALSNTGRLELLARICDAVQHAHDRGILHRDLKPANILVDADGQPKILDFGVARATNADRQVETLQTTAGQIVGTLAYMSPEQVAGDTARVDQRTDVYALGVIGFELLTGRRPIDLHDLPLHEAVRAIEQEEPTTLGSISTVFRGDVETIIGKALAKEPPARYQSAAELALDIRRMLRHEPIGARPQSRWYRWRKAARRHRALVTGVSFAFLALLLGMIGTSLGLVRARAEAEQTRRLNDYLIGMLSAFSPDESNRHEFTVRELLVDAEERMKRELADAPELQAQIQDTLANGFRALGEYEIAEQNAMAGLELRTSIFGPDSLEVADSMGTCGSILRERGASDRAERMQRGALAIRRRLLGDDDDRTAESMNNLAAVLTTSHQPEKVSEAVELLAAIIEWYRATGRPEDEHLAMTLTNYGVATFTESSFAIGSVGHTPDLPADRMAPVIAAYRKAIAIYDRLGDRGAGVAITCATLASSLQRTNDFDPDEVESLLCRCIELRRAIFPAMHPDIGSVLSDYALFLRDRGERERAVPIMIEAADIGLASGGENGAPVWTLAQAGALLMDADRPEDAEKYLRGALDGYRNQWGGFHPEAVIARARLAHCKFELDKFDDADQLLTAFEKAVENGAKVDPDILQAARQLHARVRERLRESGKADRIRESRELDGAGAGPSLS